LFLNGQKQSFVNFKQRNQLNCPFLATKIHSLMFCLKYFLFYVRSSAQWKWKKDAFVSFYQNETLSEVNLSYLELPV